MTSFHNRTFDDRDTANLKYDGWWFLTGTWNASAVGDTGTLSSSSDPFANVTFTFPEPARAFYYYAIPRCCGGMYEICIDCDPDNPHFESIDAVNATDNGANPPVVLYSKTWGTPGIHEVILRNANDTRFGNSQLTIDRFELETVVDRGASDEKESASSLPSVSSTSSSGMQMPTTPISRSSNSTSDSPVGAIVGGTIGSLVIILLVALTLWYFSRKKKRADDEKGHITAFIVDTRSNPGFVSDSKAEIPYGQRIRERDAGPVRIDTLPPDYEQVFSAEGVTESPTDEQTATSPSSRALHPNRLIV